MLNKIPYYFIIGCLMSGFQEATGIVHPLLVVLGWVLFAQELRKINQIQDVYPFFVINISYFWFYYHVVPDVLDSFFKYDNIYVAFVFNIVLAFLMQPLFIVIPLSKLLFVKYNAQNKLSLVIISSFIYSLISTYVLIVFPNNWAYSLADVIDYLTLLPWVGSFGYSFVIFLSIGYWGLYSGKKRYTVPVFCLVFFLLHLVPQKDVKYKQEPSVEIGLVQFPFHLYNKEGTFPEPRVFKQIIKKLITENSPEILYYPEGSALAVNENFSEWISLDYIDALKRAPEVVLSGYKMEDTETYNTLVKISKYQVPQIYYKSKLFPMGETDLLGLAQFINPDAKSLASKNHRTVWAVGGLSTLPLLCFENYHSFFLLKKMQQESEVVDLITIQSNESWVQSNMTRGNMFKFIQMQAKELGVAIAKIDSAGPTALIDASGQVVVKNKYPVEVVVANVKKLESNSFYSRYGASVVLLIALALLMLNWLERSLLSEPVE